MIDMNVEQVLAQMRAMNARAQGAQDESSPVGQANFGELLKNSIDRVNATQQDAAQMARDFEFGKTDASLAEVMVSLQKSNVSFQAMVQVRNKLVEAYKDVMNMPV